MKTRNNSRVGAVILAAGKSTRMGEAKQLLRLRESTVLGQTLENVRDAGLDDIILVLGSFAETIQRQLSMSDNIAVVINRAYAQGMASSLRAGLSAADPRIDAALIVLADQPFILPKTFAWIVEEYRCSHAQIVIPLYKGFRGNPVLLDRSVFAEVMALEGDIGCRAIFGNHVKGIVRLEVDDAGILLDIDTKEDYERLRRFGQSSSETEGQEDKALIEKATREARHTPGLEASGGEEASCSDQLIVAGWGRVAGALVNLGQLLNFTVTVVDPLVDIDDLPSGARLLNKLDFSLLPGTSERYVVVASRGKFDEEAVEQALQVGSAYVGLMASDGRGQKIRSSLERKGEPAEKLAAVRVPAGLDIGAKTPEEIALSIMAEIVSRRRAKLVD